MTPREHLALLQSHASGIEAEARDCMAEFDPETLLDMCEHWARAGMVAVGGRDKKAVALFTSASCFVMREYVRRKEDMLNREEAGQ